VYVKTTVRRTTDGTPVRYLHLAHNDWDPATGRSVPKILHSFGREDQVDRPAIKRLVASLSKLLDPADALAATASGELTFTGSRPYGGTHVLDALWRRLHLDAITTKLLQGTRGRPRDPIAERILFALVANRALAPSSKLAAADWITHDTHIPGLDHCDDDACYRAMDWLHSVTPTLEQEVYWSLATLLDLDVDVLFFDTTSTYFELDAADTPVARDDHGRPRPDAPITDPVRDIGFRTHGHSKDHRPDLPQIVIGMAVTRTGIPVRVWSWPGNTADATLIAQVKTDMRDWALAHIVWVADRGFASADNRRLLRSGGHHYILGEKLRSGSAEATAALSRQGRYRQITDNLRIKEVTVSDTERFVPGSPGESHPQAPTDPCVNLSIYTARAVQLSGRVPQFPVREQARGLFPDPPQTCPRFRLAAFQPLVLPHRPTHEMAIHALADRDHRARVEHGEVVQPAP
jgi:Transposase DDE domain